jgi:hypothetical protein
MQLEVPSSYRSYFVNAAELAAAPGDFIVGALDVADQRFPATHKQTGHDKNLIRYIVTAVKVIPQSCFIM